MLMEILYYLNLNVKRNFREDIYNNYLLCKKEENNIKHVINECEIMKELRDKLKNELEGLDRKTINSNLLESIEYFYYSKNYSGKKKKRKRIIKESEKLKMIRNLENIIRKMNKMILVIFGEYKYE
jgi:hypothetical protein